MAPYNSSIDWQEVALVGFATPDLARGLARDEDRARIMARADALGDPVDARRRAAAVLARIEAGRRSAHRPGRHHLGALQEHEFLCRHVHQQPALGRKTQ